MEYTKCLVELDEILRYLSEDDLAKIPYEIRDAINREKDKKYIWHYDTSKNLSEQNIDRKTIAMLSYLNMEYLLDEEQKKLMKKLHELNEQKLEKEKIKQYNPNEIFFNDCRECKQNSIMLIEKKEKWYEKTFDFLRKILKIHKN